jgi:hypothetical protein
MRRYLCLPGLLMFIPLIGRETARQAVGVVRPLFERAVQTKDLGDSGAAHVVVMDPYARPGAVAFEQALLYEESFNREHWDADYAMYARAKARLAWRTGRDTDGLARRAPQLLQPGDTLLGGGIWIDGIVVAVSGMYAWYDEALAASVAWFLRAIAKGRVAESDAAFLE